ncbi:MAG: tetratricopeptide repeat protein [Deltaproteobacteria bacterium]|nr:tetratricopeptide repeat protein [Deltaproteobacteria bacterium]
MIKGLTLVCALFFCAVTLRPSLSYAQGDPEALLRQAEKYYEALEYTQALKILLAVQQAAGVTPIQRSRAYLYMGVCFTALGKAEHAVQAFMEVLKLKPRFRLPGGVSPSIRAMFQLALKRLKMPETPPPQAGGAGTPGAPGTPGPGGKRPPKSPGMVDLTVLAAPRHAKLGMPITVEVQVQDPKKQVESIHIHWRLVGGPDYSTIKVPFEAEKDKTKLELTIPGAIQGDKPGQLLFFVQAMGGRSDKPLSRDGDEDEPHEVSLQRVGDGKSSWGWWTLGIVGSAAAIAGGVVAAVLLTRSSPTPGSGAGVSVVIR